MRRLSKLVIGIDNYKGVPKLSTAVADAKGVRDVLVSRYGFLKDHVIELYDAHLEYLPAAVIYVSDGKMHEVKTLDMIQPEPGAFYIMDRGYLDFARLYASVRFMIFLVGAKFVII